MWVGGPTHYKPLRDKVAFELGIPGSMDVNPMTAVAEGASLFAESIDWSSQNRSRKVAVDKFLLKRYNLQLYRPNTSWKCQNCCSSNRRGAPGAEFQIDSA